MASPPSLSSSLASLSFSLQAGSFPELAFKCPTPNQPYTAQSTDHELSGYSCFRALFYGKLTDGEKHSKPWRQNCSQAASLSDQGKTNLSHLSLSKHSYDQHMAQDHGSRLISRRDHKNMDFLTLRSLCCVLCPAQALARCGPGQLQKSVSSLPSYALSAIRLPLLLLQPITQASLCCAKSCSCSNTPGKSSLKHVRMRGPVW